MTKNMQNLLQKPLPFALPEIGREEIDEVVKCMESGWLTTGPRVKQFEDDFAKFVGGDAHTISINSATAGLILAMEALGIGEGDEVITTPYTFSATAMSIVHLGATPVLADINPETFNINPENIEKLITKKTKAIVPVHFAGLPCDMDKIIAIAKKHKLYVVEDAAHALPAEYKGKLIGNLDSDATIYSFYATKTITTGEGGMIVTKNPAIAKRCQIMRLHGISSDVFDRYTSTKSNWYYEITAPGYKCNMTDLAASIGIHQLQKAKRFQKRREEIKNIYFKELKNLPLALPPEAEENSSHAWHLFVIQLKNNVKISRGDFIIKMQKEFGIGCSVHFIPLNYHPYWQQKLNINEDSFPHAKNLYEYAVSLPIYTKMTDEDAHRVANAVKEILS